MNGSLPLFPPVCPRGLEKSSLTYVTHFPVPSSRCIEKRNTEQCRYVLLLQHSEGSLHPLRRILPSVKLAVHIFSSVIKTNYSRYSFYKIN
jgi:hypothetical protein